MKHSFLIFLTSLQLISFSQTNNNNNNNKNNTGSGTYDNPAHTRIIQLGWLQIR